MNALDLLLNDASVTRKPDIIRRCPKRFASSWKAGTAEESRSTVLKICKENTETNNASVLLGDDENVAIWKKAHEFVSSRKQLLMKWHNEQCAGVSDVDIDDYINQACLIAYNRFKKPDNKPDLTSIKFRLMDFMYKHRQTDKSVNRNENTEAISIVQFCNTDISEIEERLQPNQTLIQEDDNEEEKHKFVYKCMNKIDHRAAEIIKMYYGFDGRSHTFPEISEKIGLKSAGYVCVLYQKGMRELKQVMNGAM